MPKAAVGRVVHVLVDPKQNNGADVAPAIITRAWSDTCVNLRVLHDNAPVNVAPVGWMTSVNLAESREALDEGRETPATFGAFWPPHV